MKNSIANVAYVLAMLFLIVASIELDPDLFFGENAFLVSNIAYNLTHFGTAICFMGITQLDPNMLIMFIQAFGMAYLIISLIGFQSFDLQRDESFCIFQANSQNFLHFFLGAVTSLAGSHLKKKYS